MIPKTRYGRAWLLTLVAGFMLASALAMAQTPPAGEDTEEPAESATAPDVNDPDILRDIDVSKLDWSQLDLDAAPSPALHRSRAPRPKPRPAPTRRGRPTKNATAPPPYRSSNPSPRSGIRGSAPT
jgi:hypothetical protein